MGEGDGGEAERDIELEWRGDAKLSEWQWAPGRPARRLRRRNEPKEWVAQVEPGVLITFVYLPRGGNDLKRIRFSRDMFNKWQAQRWWAENYDRVMELYNVQRFNRQAFPLPTTPRSEDEVSNHISHHFSNNDMVT
ncbi:hypothetical protein GH714_026908 [Hevea brasiliensis]|uniref:BRX domain-containing protein n=1 Tax=Hevea brasiliensis TaxID=3981 RepID=A0A6A6LUZ8_HEVBR|nr:hypothetical protein GH714_026908 [Hevea brasiliensis]